MYFKKIILLIVLIIFTNSCENNQNQNYILGGYYENVYKADSLFIVENYSDSFKILDGLFSVFTPVHLPIYDEYETYTKVAWIVGEKSKGIELLVKLISDFGYEKEYIINDDILKEIYNANKKHIDKEYSDLRKEYLNKINFDLREEIIQMREADQSNRGNGKYGIEQEKIDSINEIKMINIFNKYGYPNRKLVGDYNLSMERVDLSLILLHTNDSIRISYFAPLILEYVKEGICSPLVYGRVIDQYFLYNGENQKYGTYKTPSKTNLTLNGNKKEIDSIRKTIGLPNLGYEKWRTETLYPELFNYTE